MAVTKTLQFITYYFLVANVFLISFLRERSKSIYFEYYLKPYFCVKTMMHQDFI